MPSFLDSAALKQKFSSLVSGMQGSAPSSGASGQQPMSTSAVGVSQMQPQPMAVQQQVPGQAPVQGQPMQQQGPHYQQSQPPGAAGAAMPMAPAAPPVPDPGLVTTIELRFLEFDALKLSKSKSGTMIKALTGKLDPYPAATVRIVGNEYGQVQPPLAAGRAAVDAGSSGSFNQSLSLRTDVGLPDQLIITIKDKATGIQKTASDWIGSLKDLGQDSMVGMAVIPLVAGPGVLPAGFVQAQTPATATATTTIASSMPVPPPPMATGAGAPMQVPGQQPYQYQQPHQQALAAAVRGAPISLPAPASSSLTAQQQPQVTSDQWLEIVDDQGRPAGRIHVLITIRCEARKKGLMGSIDQTIGGLGSFIQSKGWRKW